MSASPTPGPWTYGTRKDGTIWVSLGDFMTGQHYQFDWMAGEANAALAVSAPGLLAACKAAEAALVDLGACTDPDCEDCPSVISFVRKEIAKAEGRA